MELSKSELLVWLAGMLVGTQEVGGPNRGALVERFQKAVDGKANGEAWCCAFVQFLIREVDALGLAHGDQTGSPLPKTEWVQGLWDGTSPGLRRRAEIHPEPGMLIVWRQWKDGQPTAYGHVGVVTGVTPAGAIETIEGNTGAGDGINREGDGVYRRVRSASGDGALRVSGYLKVWA